MTEPTSIVWHLGVNAHGQPISVKQYRHNGHKVYEITRGQFDQRDDTSRICGLTAENLKKIAEIIQ